MSEKPSLTSAEIQAGDTTQTLPEFGRVPDVQRIFGIKRGICYRKIKQGVFKSILLREEGNKQGVRLVHLQSVKDYLQAILKQNC